MARETKAQRLQREKEERDTLAVEFKRVFHVELQKLIYDYLTFKDMYYGGDVHTSVLRLESPITGTEYHFYFFHCYEVEVIVPDMITDDLDSNAILEIEYQMTYARNKLTQYHAEVEASKAREKLKHDVIAKMKGTLPNEELEAIKGIQIVI